MGIIQLARGKTSSAFKESWFEGSSQNPSSYALALFSGLWAYDGWDQGPPELSSFRDPRLTIPPVNFVAGEMKNPGKTMPRIIHFSMTTVTVRQVLSFLVKLLKQD